MDDDPRSTEAALGPIIARLKEIERKCSAMGSRNEEFPLMQERVASIIARLEAGSDPSGQPPDYRSMARELFPVAHVFESVGFMSVGKEIAHVERRLRELAPGAGEEPSVPERGARSAARASSPPSPAGQVELADRGDNGGEERTPVPLPVIIGFAVLAGAIALAAAIVAGVGPFGSSAVVDEPTPPPAPAPATPTPLPPTPTRRPAGDAPSPAARLAEEIAQARLALGRGELDAAVAHLSAASLIDRDNEAVLEIAQALVGRFIQEANAAAHRSQWDTAEERLERARRTAMRFGLPTDLIDRAAEVHASMDRFVVIGRDQTTAIREAAGERVDVFMKDGTVRSGTIDGLEGGHLVLDVARDVGGGLFHYSDEVPLAEIEVIKIYQR